MGVVTRIYSRHQDKNRFLSPSPSDYALYALTAILLFLLCFALKEYIQNRDLPRHFLRWHSMLCPFGYRHRGGSPDYGG
jgi:hypothetical protein